MITVKDICFSYENKTVFDRFSLTLPGSGVIALMGESGSGKTTLLKLLAGLLKPQEGSINGMEGKKTAFLFQEDRLLPWRSVLRNAALGSDTQRAEKYLRMMEIENVSAMPEELSGGMQRRVSLARALAFEGDVLIMDEPFKGLDKELRERVIQRISAPLVIMSTHDITEAERMGARIISL